MKKLFLLVATVLLIGWGAQTAEARHGCRYGGSRYHSSYYSHGPSHHYYPYRSYRSYYYPRSSFYYHGGHHGHHGHHHHGHHGSGISLHFGF